jgi:hypothetical protein
MATPSPLSKAGPDPLARNAVLAVAAGRLAIGIGAFFATRRALGALGFDEPSGATVALARLAGGRDLALAAHAFAVANDPVRLREAAAIGAAVDAGDAIAFGTALVTRDGIDRTAAMNAPLGAAAAAFGLWALRRL